MHGERLEKKQNTEISLLNWKHIIYILFLVHAYIKSRYWMIGFRFVLLYLIITKLLTERHSQLITDKWLANLINTRWSWNTSVRFLSSKIPRYLTYSVQVTSVFLYTNLSYFQLWIWTSSVSGKFIHGLPFSKVFNYILQ